MLKTKLVAMLFPSSLSAITLVESTSTPIWYAPVAKPAGSVILNFTDLVLPWAMLSTGVAVVSSVLLSSTAPVLVSTTLIGVADLNEMLPLFLIATVTDPSTPGVNLLGLETDT